jgi:vacuolar-type H+-ATPase subunit C/Vma6
VSRATISATVRATNSAATSRGLLAYAHARIRACKSRLLTHTDAAPLFAAADAAAVQRAVAALDIEHPLQRLVHVYATAIRGYRRGEPLLRALLARHEIENVKLLWRTTARPGQREALSPLWLDLGALATVSMVDAASPREFAEQLARTPYAKIAATVARAHGTDVAAAELAFDRWVSQRLLDEARRLPRGESLVRQLVALVVRERDAEIVRRGVKWYGLASVSGNIEDVAVMRRERLRLCRRAFVGSPFLLAPAVAVILLAEEEVRALQALVERQGDVHLDEPLLRALAGSEIGA